MLVVLGRRPHEGGTTDVDHVDRRCLCLVLEGRRICPERVEVADHDVDQIDPVGLEVGEVIGITTIGQDGTVHLRMQGDHTVAEHRGETGEFGNVDHRDSGICDRSRRPTGRHQLDLEVVEGLGQFHDAGLVVDREKSTHGVET